MHPLLNSVDAQPSTNDPHSSAHINANGSDLSVLVGIPENGMSLVCKFTDNIPFHLFPTSIKPAIIFMICYSCSTYIIQRTTQLQYCSMQNYTIEFVRDSQCQQYE